MSVTRRLLQVRCTIAGQQLWVDAPGVRGLRQLAWRMISAYAVVMMIFKFALVGRPFTPGLIAALPMGIMAVVRGVLMAREHQCEGAGVKRLDVAPTGRQIPSVRVLITVLSAMAGCASGLLAILLFPLDFDTTGILLVVCLTLWEGLMGAIRVGSRPLGSDWIPQYGPAENQAMTGIADITPPIALEFGSPAEPIITQTPGELHATTDFNRAPELLEIDDITEPPSRIISTPADLAGWQSKWSRVRSRDEKIPTDVFVWDSRTSAGQPVTRFGGLPHRPQDQKWPKRKDGRPLRFVMQWSFVDSKDIIDTTLPGDVLCLFDDADPDRPSDTIGDTYHLEWNDRDIANVCSSAPAGCSLPFELTGVRTRVEQSPDTPYPNHKYKTRELQATIIGRHVFWPQCNDLDERVLCAFSECSLCYPWPTVDRRELADSSRFASLTPLSLLDAGVLIVTQNPDGSVDSQLQYY